MCALASAAGVWDRSVAVRAQTPTASPVSAAAVPNARFGTACSVEGQLGRSAHYLICRGAKWAYATYADAPTPPPGGYATRPDWYPRLTDVFPALMPCPAGGVQLTQSVLPLADLRPSVPYGSIVGDHVTPIDHGYLGLKSLEIPQNQRTESDYSAVTSPADGWIVEASSLGSPTSHRVVIDHGCGVYTVFMVINRLTGFLEPYAARVMAGERLGPIGKISAGEEFGRQRDNPLDFNVFDDAVWLTGLAHPFSYAVESWKPYTANPVPYFSPALGSFYDQLMQRTASPRWGRIDHDLLGSAQGNWFLDGTLGYSCVTEQVAADATAEIPGGTLMPGKKGISWCHLALVPHHVQPATMMASFGMWNDAAGDFKQYMIKLSAGQPEPGNVTADSGTIVYEIAQYNNVNADGSPINFQGYWPIGYKPVAGFTAGFLAVRVNPDGTMTAQTLPGATSPSAFTGFSSNQRLYRRAASPASNPVMSLDAPSSSTTVGKTFSASGWTADLGAISGTGIDAVHLYAYPIVNGSFGSPVFFGQTQSWSTRGDVGSVFGVNFANSGFQVSGTLDIGDYRLVAYGRSRLTNSFNVARSADITVAGPVSRPEMSLDGPSEGQTVTQPFVTGGWAIDLGASAGTGVDAIHVWAFPVVNGVVGAGRFVDQATLNGGRPDVGAVFGSQFNNSGFNFLMTGLSPGSYIVGVYAHSGVTGTFNQAKFVTITVQ